MDVLILIWFSFRAIELLFNILVNCKYRKQLQHFAHMIFVAPNFYLSSTVWVGKIEPFKVRKTL
jgi:hypothetical protein